MCWCRRVLDPPSPRKPLGLWPRFYSSVGYSHRAYTRYSCRRDSFRCALDVEQLHHLLLNSVSVSRARPLPFPRATRIFRHLRRARTSPLALEFLTRHSVVRGMPGAAMQTQRRHIYGDLLICRLRFSETLRAWETTLRFFEHANRSHTPDRFLRKALRRGECQPWEPGDAVAGGGIPKHLVGPQDR